MVLALVLVLLLVLDLFFVLVLLLLTLLVLVQVLVVGEMVSSRLPQGRRFYLSPLVFVEIETTALISSLPEVGGTIGLLVVWCF